MSNFPQQCVHCGSRNLFKRRVAAGGTYGPNLLEGLGGFMQFAQFDVVMCSDCGHCELFADEEARQNVLKRWERLGDAG